MISGPLARLLLRRAGHSIAAAALMGAVVLQIADLVAQHALPWQISTGVVTGVFGAPYIAWTLIQADRRRAPPGMGEGHCGRTVSVRGGRVVRRRVR